MEPLFDENGLATEAGEIRCFYYDSVTQEYIGWSDEYINSGVSMPGYSTAIDPGEEIAGQVAIFTGTVWEKREDHRGETVFSTENGSSSVVDYIGEIQEGFVTDAPATPYDMWDGKEWITDTGAKHDAEVKVAEAQKQSLLVTASEAIAPLQDAVDLGIATEAEKNRLLVLKKYRVMINRVDCNKPSWPEQPDI